MVVFLIGGGNGSVREQEHEKHHAAAMQRWGKAQSRTMNRVKRQVAAARRAAEAGQQVTDPELVDALTELRAAKRKRELARPRAPPERLEPAATRSAQHGHLLVVRSQSTQANGYRLVDLDNLHEVLAHYQCEGCSWRCSTLQGYLNGDEVTFKLKFRMSWANVQFISQTLEAGGYCCTNRCPDRAKRVTSIFKVGVCLYYDGALQGRRQYGWRCGESGQVDRRAVHCRLLRGCGCVLAAHLYAKHP